MHQIEMNEMSKEFLACWEAARIHLNKQVAGGIQTWLREHPNPPFFEHLSFRIGNQLFFVRIEDVDGKVNGPGNPQGHTIAARLANGRACVLPMRRPFSIGSWEPALPGLGLLDAQSRRPIDPLALVTDEKIEMTRWERHDMAVQIVCNQLRKQGFEILAWQGNPEVDPSIWIKGKARQPEWVVVRHARYPANSAPRPGNWRMIAARCARLGTTGHFASVAFASVEQPFVSESEPAIPLWRGRGVHVNFSGLE